MVHCVKKQKTKRVVLKKMMEMFEKQLRPAAVLRARQKANTMKSMKMTQQTKCGEPAFRSINQIEEFLDRGVLLCEKENLSSDARTFTSKGIPL